MRTPAEYCGASSGGILEHELNLLINESHGHISNKCVLDVPALSRAVKTGGTAEHFSKCLDSGLPGCRLIWNWQCCQRGPLWARDESRKRMPSGLKSLKQRNNSAALRLLSTQLQAQILIPHALCLAPWLCHNASAPPLNTARQRAMPTVLDMWWM